MFLFVFLFATIISATENALEQQLQLQESQQQEQQQLQQQHSTALEPHFASFVEHLPNHARCRRCVSQPRRQQQIQTTSEPLPTTVWCRKRCNADDAPSDVFPRFCRPNVRAHLIKLISVVRSKSKAYFNRSKMNNMMIKYDRLLLIIDYL